MFSSVLKLHGLAFGIMELSILKGNIRVLRLDIRKALLFSRMAFCCLIFILISPQVAESNEKELYEKALNNYEQLLKLAIKNSNVDYELIKKNQHFIEHLLYAISILSPNQLQEDEQLALYLNAYNLFTLRLVLDYWPRIESIKDIPEYPLSRRWKDQRWLLGGTRISINDLKLNYLRSFKNPLIYFALACTGVSCPDLSPVVFRATSIHRQLDQVTRNFLNEQKALQWQLVTQLVGDPEPVVFLSQLFKWEETDFLINNYSILGFVEEFGPMEFKEFVRNHKESIQIKYLNFDWNLNSN